MITELIARVFAARNASQLAHWAARGPGSYATHVALSEFYESVIDPLDKLVECYQGNFDLVGEVKAYELKKGDILKQLSDEVVWIGKNRSEIAQDVNALENIVDELTSVYLRAIYKLRNLR